MSKLDYSPELLLYLNKLNNSPLFSFDVMNIAGLTEEKIIRTIEYEKSLNFSIIESREGKVSKVEDTNNARDFGKHNDSLPFHMDGGYYDNIPKYAILYCVRSSSSEGRTFFTESKYVVDRLIQNYQLKLLASLNIVWISVHKKKYRKPIIEKIDGGYQLNWYSGCLYIEPDAQLLPEENRACITTTICQLTQDIEAWLVEGISLKHQWNDGDLLIFNNQLMLHGRESFFGDENNRLLYRVWFDTKDSDKMRCSTSSDSVY